MPAMTGVCVCVSSRQDVWSELGPPSSTAAKGADTMLIHMKVPAASGADYFYNYHSRCGPVFGGALTSTCDDHLEITNFGLGLHPPSPPLDMPACSTCYGRLALSHILMRLLQVHVRLGTAPALWLEDCCVCPAGE